MTSLILCPQCQHKGIQSSLKSFVCGWFHTALLCERPDCTYPLEESHCWFAESTVPRQDNLILPPVSDIHTPPSDIPESDSDYSTNKATFYLDNQNENTDNELDFLDDLFAEESISAPIQTKFLQKPFMSTSLKSTLLQPSSTPAASYPSVSSSQKSDSLDDIMPSLRNVPFRLSSPLPLPDNQDEVSPDSDLWTNKQYCWMSQQKFPIWLRFLQHIVVHIRSLHTLNRTPMGDLQAAYNASMYETEKCTPNGSNFSDASTKKSFFTLVNRFSDTFLRSPLIKEHFPLLAAFLYIFESDEVLKKKFAITYSQETCCTKCGSGCRLQRSSCHLNFSHKISHNFRMENGAETITVCDKCREKTKVVRTTIDKMSSSLLIRFQQSLHQNFQLDRDLSFKEGLSPSMIIESSGLILKKLWIRHPYKNNLWLKLYPSDKQFIKFEEHTLSSLSSPLISLVLLEKTSSSPLPANRRKHPCPTAASPSIITDSEEMYARSRHRKSISQSRSVVSMPQWRRDVGEHHRSSIKGITPADQTYLLTRYLANEVKQGDSLLNSQAAIPRGSSYLEDIQREAEKNGSQLPLCTSFYSDNQPMNKRQKTVKDLILMKARAIPR